MDIVIGEAANGYSAGKVFEQDNMTVYLGASNTYRDHRYIASITFGHGHEFLHVLVTDVEIVNEFRNLYRSTEENPKFFDLSWKVLMDYFWKNPTDFHKYLDIVRRAARAQGANDLRTDIHRLLHINNTW